MPRLPQQFLNSLISLKDFDEKAFVDSHQEENKITSIRLNPFKKVDLDFILDESVNWNSKGFYLDERPSFTHDPLFQAGCYYPQEAGSMFLEFALKQTLNFSEKLRILDVCAAPGGKSTLINSLLNKESLLVANELIKSRADVLSQNLSKWGTCNTIVTNNEPHKYSALTSFFDAVIVDAPCSGSGLFRKQPEAIEEWSLDHVHSCSLRQKKILADVIPCLKDNGILIYSTCSYSIQENENVVEKLINDFNFEYISLPVGNDWGIVETKFGYRFYPYLTKSEGFFCAVLRKKTHEEPVYVSKKKKINEELTKTEREVLNPYLSNLNALIFKKNNYYHLVNEEVMLFLNAFDKQFYFKKAGVVIGEIKGKDMVPHQELAWYTELNEGIMRLNLDKENAIKFFKKENFLSQESTKGFVLITYKNQGLGWAKILPNRINNYLPNELRILK